MNNNKGKQAMENLLVEMFRHQLMIKMYHFQTKHYGAHKASDKYLGRFRDHLDKFMEVAQGIYGRVGHSQVNANVQTATDDTIQGELDSFILMLAKLEADFPNKTDLLNIKDEMIADANQLKYLLTFK